MKKKKWQCALCEFSTNNAGAFTIHMKHKHPAEKPVWRSYREFVRIESEWGKKCLKKELNDFPGFDALQYALLLKIFDELVLIRQELKKVKTII